MTSVLQFGRQYKFSFGPPGLAGFSFSELAMSFEVTKTIRRGANKATFNIINLDAVSIGLLEQPGTVVVFDAGYQLPGMLFQGNISRRGVVTKKDGSGNQVTTIQAGEKELEMQKARVSVSLTAGSPSTLALTQIALALADPLGVPLGLGNTALFPPKIYLGGFAFSGFARAALDEISRDVGASSWSIAAGQIFFHNNLISANPVDTVLSPQTGLLQAERTKKGISATALLNPQIVEGGLISVIDGASTGVFKSHIVTHAGDFRGDSWTTKIEGREFPGSVSS